jgi:hypothetical protein
VMEHEHRHRHDEHHQHTHGPDDPAGEPHGIGTNRSFTDTRTIQTCIIGTAISCALSRYTSFTVTGMRISGSERRVARGTDGVPTVTSGLRSPSGWPVSGVEPQSKNRPLNARTPTTRIRDGGSFACQMPRRGDT